MEISFSQLSTDVLTALNSKPPKKREIEYRFYQACRLVKNSSTLNHFLEWIGQIISSELLDTDTYRFMVDQWIKCKIHLSKNDLNQSCIEEKTIAHYLKSEDKSKIIDALIMELNFYHSYLKRPPTMEFHVLSKLLEFSDNQSTSHFLARALMLTLLHAWPDSFDYCSDSLCLVPNFDFPHEVEIAWEAKGIIMFYSFMYYYEDFLCKAFESIKNFKTSELKTSDGSLLSWFPSDVIPPNRDFLLSLVNYLDCLLLDHVQYFDDVLQCYKVLLVLLDIFEEKSLLKTTLTNLENILHLSIKKEEKGKLANTIHLISTKCCSSKLSFECTLHDDALEKAEEAMYLVAEFEKNENENKAIQMKFCYARIESQLCLAKAKAAHHKISEASQILHDVVKDEFLTANNIKASRTAALASSHVDLISSELCDYIPLDHAHSLYNALTAVTTICMRLDMVCPGICQVLNCYESPNVKQQAPYFGKNTKDSSNDMVFQFQHIQQLLSGLYRVAYLWLQSGNFRFCLLYITDGIVLSRYLGFPEKEVKFECLMVKLALMEQNAAKLLDELNIMTDILNFICDLDKGRKPKRLKLCSKEKSGTKKKFENDVELEKDESDNLQIHSIPIDVDDVQALNATDTTPPCMNQSATSPLLKRRNATAHKQPSILNHHSTCSCRLCSNSFLQEQQCTWTVLCAAYFEMFDNHDEAMKQYEYSKTRFCNKQKNKRNQVDDVLIKEMEVLACFADARFKCGDVLSAKLFTCKGLQYIEESSHVVKSSVILSFYKTAGKILLHPPERITLDTSTYVDKILDFSMKSSSNATDFPEESLIANLGDLKLEPEAEKSTISTPFSKKLNKELSSVGKTPQSKRKGRADKVMKSGRKPTKKSVSNKFEIFDDDDECDVTIELKDGKSKRRDLPIPELNLKPQTRKQSAAGGERRRTRKVLFNFSDDSGDENFTPNQFKTPARPTRSSQRLATRNVITARKEARLLHKKDWGPVYTNEEVEVSRPARRKLARTRKATSSNEADSEEIECARDSVCSVKVDTPLLNEFVNSPSLPVFNGEYDIDNLSCDGYLHKALSLSNHTSDFQSFKSCSRLLAIHHHRHGDNVKSSANHILSIGVTLRITSHINMRLCIKSIERTMKKQGTNLKDAGQDRYVRALNEMIRFTHTSQIARFIEAPGDLISHVCSRIPSDWSVCLLSTFNECNHRLLMVTKLRRGREPLHLQLDGSALQDLRGKFQHIIDYNVSTMKTTEKSLWWTQRRNANKLLDQFVKELEKSLGCHAGVLLGPPVDQPCKDDLSGCVDEIVKVLSKAAGVELSNFRDLVEIYIVAWKKMSPDEKTRIVLELLRVAEVEASDEMVTSVVGAIEAYRVHLRMHKCKLGHTILILDKDVQCYPWESMPMLHSHSVSRMTSIETLLLQLQLSESDSHAQVDLQKVAYVINPMGDLVKTEKRFGDWFSSIQSWRGALSRVPKRNEWINYLSEQDVFVFCGHGSGSSFMFQEVIARRPNSACALLMGCSSGVLREQGVAEPAGMAVAYLMSGSPCVLACLWAVTDKDIDRYLAKCLTDWMKEGTSLTDIVRKAEAACKIPRLNGSACVVYGIPVRSCRSVTRWLDSVPEHFKDILL